MRFMLRYISALFLLVASYQANATGVEFRVANETAEMLYMYKSSTFGYGGSDVAWGYLFNENEDKMFTGSLLVSGNGAGDARALQFGVGVKIFLADVGGVADVQGGGLGIGGLIRYVFPSATPVAVLVEAYAVPAITSFGDTSNFFESRFALELEVSPSARAYVGYKWVNFDDDANNEYEIDNTAHVGVRLSF
ncbi:MAG: YfaZ family protein [Gammaproteobacteria bacterium]|nr:YfaZ family protein [Gammaproteobacteria bacterium]